MLMIDNATVARVLTMKDCIERQEEAFKAIETGRAIHRPRIDMYVPAERADGYYRWGTMEGAYDGVFSIRMKSDVVAWPNGTAGSREEKYCISPGTFCGLVMLFSSRNGEPLAIINDGLLQHMRVGGGAGIGAKHLARSNAKVVGLIGSGGMARTYLEAFCEVRPIESCKVYSPTEKNRKHFAEEMAAKLGIEVIAVDSADEAAADVDILATATDSMSPTIQPQHLRRGMHIAMLGPCEISPVVESMFDVKIRQGVAGLKIPESDRVRAEIGMSPIAWVAGTQEEMKRLPERTKGNGFGGDFPDFCDLTFGRAKGRSSDEQITYYHNMGNQGLQFAAIGGLVLQKVKESGLGHTIPTEWFVQDIRD